MSNNVYIFKAHDEKEFYRIGKSIANYKEK